MQLFLTSVLPFLAHDHASAAAFLTCRHHNFHGSIIPEFLSDEERVKSFCEARQENQLEADKERQYNNMYNLFVQTPLMQFSPSLLLCQKDCAESILKPLLKTKYFTRTLQRCSFREQVEINSNIMQGLSQVQSLTKLDFGESEVENHHLEIIVNCFPSLETLTIECARKLKAPYDDPSQPAIKFISPPPPATKTMRSLTMHLVHALLATQFVPVYFKNLRKLELNGRNSSQELDLQPLSFSLPFLADLAVVTFTPTNTESLNELVHLASLAFSWCHLPDSLCFLSKKTSIPELRVLCVQFCRGLSTSWFASLVNAPNLHVLKLHSGKVNNDCLHYLEDMVHLRTLRLTSSHIVGDSRPFKTLMQNLFQLEELNLHFCRVGNQGAIAGALYSTHSRLRILDLSYCNVVDDDLNGIGALKNTLEVLDLAYNYELTSEALVHCRDLAKLRKLKLERCDGINDLSPLKHCLSLEELGVDGCKGLDDESFKVFSEEPNSFPNLQVLSMPHCEQLTEKVFEHLSKNNHLVQQLKDLSVGGMSEMISSSPTARNKICQLQGLRTLRGLVHATPESDRSNLKGELLQRLKNLDEISSC